MPAFICKQPNGLYCRFSTVVDTVTNYNMTIDDYVNICIEKAKKEAIDTIKNYLQPFEIIENSFIDNNMSKKEFEEILKKMNEPIKNK